MITECPIEINITDYTDYTNYTNYTNLLNQYNISDYNYIYSLSSIFIFFSIILLSFSTSFLFISYFVYKPMNLHFYKFYKKNPKLYECDVFLFEYLDEYYDLKDKELDDTFLKKLKNKYIKYTTSYGDIILYYNFYNSSFNYYSKYAHTIPFQYLDVISRIYIVKYDCKKIYIDNFDNIIETNNESSDNDNHNDNDNDNDNDLSNNSNLIKNKIFYSSKSSNPSNPSNPSNLSNPSNPSNNSKNLVGSFISNKYKYKGTIDLFQKKVNNYKIFNSDNKYIHDLSSCYNDTFYLINKNSINLSELSNNYLLNNNSSENYSENYSDFTLSSDEFYDSNSNSNININTNNISFKDFKAINTINTINTISGQTSTSFST